METEFVMKKNNTTYQTTDSKGNNVTYGSDRFGSWLEFPDKRDRTAIYGNSRINRERMRREISERGIKIPTNHMHIFAEPMELAA
jgi:hypothetical protein